MIYSTAGLVFISANAMLARALYAMKDTRTPTVTTAWSVALNIPLNLLFVAVIPRLTRGTTSPFLQELGGLKESGFGKEGPRYAVEEMTELKMVVFHLSD